MIHRQVPQEARTLYLTFDDGPSPVDTPAVLEILDRHQVKATFFLVAQKAQAYPELTAEILRRGHSIGNHSLDHTYGVFFRGKNALKAWVQNARQVFEKLGVHDLVGFRPPVGIVTPELKIALNELEIPLILWDTRFYDSLWRWTPKKALQALHKVKSGSIILLHDVQKEKNRTEFLSTLELFITKSIEQNWLFDKLHAHNFSLSFSRPRH